MRSIFWIGCILVVLVSLLASGAIAESLNNSTVGAAVAQAGNVTDVAKQVATNVSAAAAQAGNVTGVVKEAAVAGISGAENVTNATTKVAATVGTAPAAAKNVTNVSTNKTATPPDLVNDTLVKFVTDASTYAKNKGKTAALTSFNNPMGGFVNKNMSIFAYDYDGKALALPYSIGSVGTNQIGLTDPSGFRYVEQMRNMAKIGKGAFVTYKEANPLSMGVVMKKVSYVINVDGNYWIGAGVFLPDAKKPVVPVAKPTVVNTTAPNATAVKA
jgi:hypothetical protein